MTTTTATTPIRREAPRVAKPAPPQIPIDREQDYKPISWPLLRRMLGTLAQYKRSYAIGLTIGLIIVILELQGPRFMQALINYVTAYTTGTLAVKKHSDSHFESLAEVELPIAGFSQTISMRDVARRIGECPPE